MGGANDMGGALEMLICWRVLLGNVSYLPWGNSWYIILHLLDTLKFWVYSEVSRVFEDSWNAVPVVCSLVGSLSWTFLVSVMGWVCFEQPPFGWVKRGQLGQGDLNLNDPKCKFMRMGIPWYGQTRKERWSVRVMGSPVICLLWAACYCANG